MKITQTIAIVISISIILFAGFLIGSSCESYCSTCNGYSLFFAKSILGFILLLFGLCLINKTIKNQIYKKYLYALLFGYSLLLFVYGTYVSFSSAKILIEVYEKKNDGYMEGIVIEADPISESILIFTSLILCFYSIFKLRGNVPKW